MFGRLLGAIVPAEFVVAVCKVNILLVEYRGMVPLDAAANKKVQHGRTCKELTMEPLAYGAVAVFWAFPDSIDT